MIVPSVVGDRSRTFVNAVPVYVLWSSDALVQHGHCGGRTVGEVIPDSGATSAANGRRAPCEEETSSAMFYSYVAVGVVSVLFGGPVH